MRVFVAESAGARIRGPRTGSGRDVADEGHRSDDRTEYGTGQSGRPENRRSGRSGRELEKQPAHDVYAGRVDRGLGVFAFEGNCQAERQLGEFSASKEVCASYAVRRKASLS